jgi:hypothetical protein
MAVPGDRRVLACMLAIVAVAAACVPPPASAQAPEPMSWSVLSRFGGDADGDGRLDRVEPGSSANLGVFSLLVRPSIAVCEADGPGEWFVDGEPAEPVEPPRSDGALCQATLQVRGEGEHTIEVRVATRSEIANVEIDDRLIIALGDSVASGEGNPLSGDERWLDPPCHRSAAAGFEQATRLLAEGLGHSSITFVSLACSGAEIDEGLLEPYAGVAPAAGEPSYAPQLTRLRTLADARAGASLERPIVDAVLVSVGANDVHFSEVVKECASPGDCRAEFDEQVFTELDALSRRYDALAAELALAAPRSPVLVSEYFDPTRDEDGGFCPWSVGLTKQEEARWAYEALLRPLNAEIYAAARRHAWHVVGGIAADFERHGYCAGSGTTWIRRLGQSLLSQGDLVGTLHPNERGHAAIGDRAARALDAVLALGVAPPAPEADDDGGLPGLAWVAIVLVGAVLAAPAIAYLVWLLSGWPPRRWPLLVAVWLVSLLALVVLFPILALAFVLGRLWRLLRPTYRPDPANAAPAPPTLPAVGRRPSPLQLLVLLAVLVVLGALALLFAGIVGSAILWVRFWSVNLPADQAVNAVARDELVTTGTQALGLFAVLGLLAVVIVWLLDGNGQWVRATRRGLLAIAVAELLVAVLIGDYESSQTLELIAGLTIAALLVHFLVERALELNWTRVARRPLISELAHRLAAVFGHADGREPRFEWRLVPWRAVPLALLAFAFYGSLVADDLDRWLLIAIPLTLAAIAFVLPGGLAGTRALQADDAAPALLDPARITLAAGGLACVVALLVRDAAWLAGTALIATVLALTCLAIAAASRQRFAPYGLAVLISVPVFGAGAVILRGVDVPEVQPVAVTLEDGTPVCGIYVGESDDRLWIGRVELDELGHVRRPQPRRGRIFPVDSDSVAELAIGPLQPVTRAETQALILRDELLDASGDTKPEHRTPRCEPEAAPEPLDEESWQRDLADRYQPELIIDREDDFWPIPVRTLFSMQDRRATACRRVGTDEDDCVRLTTQGEFPWSGGEGESIEYPADDRSSGAQHDLMIDALGSIDPVRSAREYFLVAGERKGPEPVTLQYWFFYSFNYQPTSAGLHFGFHEGDFESIGILLSGRRHQPRYVWMARHSDEGRVFPWNDDALTILNDHVRAFVARGSHATYENCALQLRPAAPGGLIDDRPTCDEDRQLHLAPEATPMTDLSRVAWGCWHGNFGHRRGERTYEQIPYLVNDAPLSPFWQQSFDDVVSEPCRGVEDPGGREGLGEEVVEEGTGVPEMLRDRAGRLEPLVDECADWETPPADGTYMVVCNQDALRSYVESGFEDPGPAGVRIDVADLERPEIGEISLPAIRRDPEGVYLDSWRITAANPIVVSVFAACRQGGRMVAARFTSVPVEPAAPLRLSDRDPAGWRLRTEDGTTVAMETPFVVRGDKPEAGERLSCGGAIE